MYEDHWQLTAKPFEPVDDDASFFQSETHRGALLKLKYAVEQRRSAAVLAGPSGTGKSLVASKLIEDGSDSLGPVARVVFPQMSQRELLAYVASKLGANNGSLEPMSTEASLQQLESLFKQNLANGKHALLAIDEAHLLDDTGLLETIRLLLNLGPNHQPPMTVLLIGQMGLLSALRRTPSLEERVSVTSLLRAFSVDETSDYVQHRLMAAGATHTIFDDNAIQMMHALTGGIARRIDRLGDLALVVAFADGLKTIGAEHIESVSRELLAVTPE